MAPVIVSKRGFLALVLWVLKGRNGCRVIIRIETGHSNLVSCFGPRIRALARYFTSAFASVKYLSQRPHPRAKTWHKIWMTGLNPTLNHVNKRYPRYNINWYNYLSVLKLNLNHASLIDAWVQYSHVINFPKMQKNIITMSLPFT